jgi:quercetin dioxygenase-like cupin family protein
VRHVTHLADLADLEPIQVWDGVRVRRVEGDHVTLAIVELDPNQVVPEHAHPNEQNGLVLSGEMRFRVGDEEQVLGPGGTWQIPSNVPHQAQAGAEGAVVIDVFSPIRSDWDSRPILERTTPRWP